MDDVYAAWSEYNQRWTDLGRPELYFVKTDIVNCYDTILQKQLYRVLEDIFSQVLYEPRCEKTGLRGLRPGLTQTGLYSHRRWLEA